MKLSLGRFDYLWGGGGDSLRCCDEEILQIIDE
jgi:hypothetical protein